MVNIKTTDTLAIVTAPYDPEFPGRARKLGGAFDGTAKTWTFDIRDLDKVRDLCRDIYGTDGRPDDRPTVTITIPMQVLGGYSLDSIGQEFRAAGRRLVWRPGRDMDVRYADGVTLAAGDFPGSGGSVAHPRLMPREGTVIQVRDLPMDVVDKIRAEYKGVVIVDDNAAVRDALLAEKDTLLARVAEIDTELAALELPA